MQYTYTYTAPLRTTVLSWGYYGHEGGYSRGTRDTGIFGFVCEFRVHGADTAQKAARFSRKAVRRTGCVAVELDVRAGDLQSARVIVCVLALKVDSDVLWEWQLFVVFLIVKFEQKLNTLQMCSEIRKLF